MRPKLHFTPSKGWMNDPNGLIYVDGIYHIFFQHYPEDTKWGPMHWGHATSKDLLHFEEKEIALYPTEDEYIFSGSAILDTENISGLGSVQKPAMLLFYTSHNPKTGEQMQSLAYSTDYLHFEKYHKNPIIKNEINMPEYKKDFRDPKVFRNEEKGGYSMVLAVGDHIEFLHSKNLLEWEYTGAFYPGEYGYSGICECPDLIQMNYRGQKVSVLTMSMIFKEEEKTAETHIMQYFVGKFDSNCFQNVQEYDDTMRLDYGEDHYAAVTFANTENPIILGWGEDWNKARVNKATCYFGKLTIARKLVLKEANAKLYLAQNPIVGIEEFSEALWQKEFVLEEGQEIVVADGLHIGNKGKDLFINDVEIQRVDSCSKCQLKVIYDSGYYEIFADGGLISFSQEIN